MTPARLPALSLVALLVLSACGSDSEPSPGTGGAAGAAGAAGDASADPVDPCEANLDRGACCAAGCGWHEHAGHAYCTVPSCVALERVCEVEGEPVRECPVGMTCLPYAGGGAPTENDCAELPPDPDPTKIDLKGRGICVWPSACPHMSGGG